MIQVKQDVPVYEIDGNDAAQIPGESPIKVCSYYSRLDAKKRWVTLIVDGTKYTVDAIDLYAAIENALNINR